MRGAIAIANLIDPTSATVAVTTRSENGCASGKSAPLGKRIRGFQHFGMTVQNMDRAFEFYTEILGGTEIMRDGEFHGEKIQNTLMLNDEIEAFEQKIDPVTIAFWTCAAGNNDWTCASHNSTTWVWSCCTIARIPNRPVAGLLGLRRTIIEALRTQGRFTSAFICGMTSTSTNSSVMSKLSRCGEE